MKHLTNRNELGLAGEFRVMAELFLRGHNPAKSYLEKGADIILENGIKLEVKASHRHSGNYKATDRTKGFRTRSVYVFTLKGAGRRPYQLDTCDFLILWCIDDDCFFVIPTESVLAKTCVSLVSADTQGRYAKYKNAWHLLNGNEVVRK